MKTFYAGSLFVLFSGLSLAASAATLTPQEALARVKKSDTGKRIHANAARPVLKYTLSTMEATTEAQPTLYVFDNGDNKGFMIVSADDGAYPLLGYSDTGCFDAANIPPELNYWLNEYSRQISTLKNGKYHASEPAVNASSPTGMQSIGPLLKSKWNQGEPYNKYCFELSADGTQTQSVTGCVATSMAQVMYYFKQPTTGHGEISYKHGDSGTYEMDFGAQSFNWKDMLPTYYPHSYNEDEADAVAYLMKACGYSVRMDYSKGDAGASGTAIAGALINYFGYNKNIEVQTRKFYTYDEWATMIYNNLKNVGPVIYNGSALDGGHSFVCDGYDGNGYFHINWGWGGMSDGYYLLDALNPDEFGIGGAAGGYNLGQQIILNITPDSGEDINPRLMQIGNVTGRITDGKLFLKLDDSADAGFQYINPTPLTLTFGIKVINASNPSAQPQYFESDNKNLEAREGSFYRWDKVGTDIDLSKVNMTEGEEYNFIIATNITYNSTSQWNEVAAMPGKYNYVTVKKTGEGYEINENTVGNISVSDFQIISDPVYWNMPVKFSAEFSNKSASSLTRNYSAVFFDSEGKECYKMENYSINADANTTQTVSWTSVEWYKENGASDITEATEFTVKLYDNWQGEYVDGIEQTVTVEPEAGKAKVESELTILNGTKSGDMYVIDGDELEVSLNVKVTEGIFNHTIMLALQAPMSDGKYMTIMHKHFDAIPNLSAGEEQTYEMSVKPDDIDPDTIYRVEVWGPDGGFNETALVVFNLKADGISDIKPDNEGHYTIYKTDGTLTGIFDNPDIIHSLPKGIYIVNGIKLIR